jgi:hypothetical protein
MDEAAWLRLIAGRNDDFDALRVVAPEPAGGTWSGPFRALASDGESYFVKSLATCPPGQEASLVIERVVAAVGGLIGAPVCRTTLIRIPGDLDGHEVRPGALLTAGLAHASRALEHADEMGRPNLYARSQDDNVRRHVGVYALYDWCCGSDQQWLYDLDADRTIYSHDHGLYLPPVGTGMLDAHALRTNVGLVYELPDPAAGLSAAAVDDVATALERLAPVDLAAVMRSVPASWPVDDDDLATLAWFLEQRASGVAARLRARV